MGQFFSNKGVQEIQPTGGASDNLTINAAITKANAAGGGIVQLSVGTFNCVNSVLLLSNVWLRGQGSATILKNTQGINPTKHCLDVNLQDNVIMTDFCIDGNLAVNGRNSSDISMDLAIRFSSNVIAYNIEAKNSPSQGIAVYAGDSLGDLGSFNVKVDTCNSHDNNLRGLYAQGILDTVIFDKCTVYDNDFSGMLLGMNASSDITVSNCTFRDNGNKVDCSFGYTRPEIEINAIDSTAAVPGPAGLSVRRKFINNKVSRSGAASKFTLLNDGSGGLLFRLSPLANNLLVSGNSFYSDVEGNYYDFSLLGPIRGFKFTDNEYNSTSPTIAAGSQGPVSLRRSGNPSSWAASTAYKNIVSVMPLTKTIVVATMVQQPGAGDVLTQANAANATLTVVSSTATTITGTMPGNQIWDNTNAFTSNDTNETMNPASNTPTAGPNDFRYYATVVDEDNRTSGGSEPTWPTYEGATVVDGDITWTAVRNKAVYDSQFIGNSFKSSNFALIMRAGVESLIIAGNTFESLQYGNIYFDSAGTEPLSKSIITGNTFRTITPTNVRSSIRDYGGSADWNIIKDNIYEYSDFENLGGGNNIISDNIAY